MRRFPEDESQRILIRRCKIVSTFQEFEEAQEVACRLIRSEGFDHNQPILYYSEDFANQIKHRVGRDCNLTQT